MSFENLLNQAWSDHAKDASAVAGRLPQMLAALERNEQIPGFANLVMHVFGEHLGRWTEGIRFLQALKAHPVFLASTESQQAIERATATLEYANGNESILQSFANSDQIRILATAASALAGQNQIDRARTVFRKSLEQAQFGLPKEDPANRALAVTGNNMASALEEKPNLTPDEVEVMILAAQAGRKFWEIAGTWNQVLWAEYRLAQTYLKANDLRQALEHAQTCLEIGNQNQAPDLEMFFGYEALTLVEKKRKNQLGFTTALQQAEGLFQKLKSDDQKWCQDILHKMQS